ncbi:MAG TPA: hypothetical protein VEL28_19490 [Candidatus Binatia bacterium]|nr:hypothetical protein [Candidatus Binatia bacterium]
MKSPMLTLTLSTCLVASAAGAGAAENDHLKCYKIKDVKTFQSATADLDALRAEFGLENCSIKPAAKLVCVPVTKNLTNLDGGNPADVEGDPQTDNRLCYRIKCPKSEIAPTFFTDQFGSRQVRAVKAVRLCTPAIQGLTPGFGIDLIKLTNGTDNNTAPGPTVPIGSTVTFTYVVTNSSGGPLSAVVVRDDNGTPGNAADDFNATFSGGDSNGSGLLDPGETFTFVASRIATPGPYVNTGTATGQAEGGQTLTDSDQDHHVGI